MASTLQTEIVRIMRMQQTKKIYCAYALHFQIKYKNRNWSEVSLWKIIKYKNHGRKKMCSSTSKIVWARWWWAHRLIFFSRQTGQTTLKPKNDWLPAHQTILKKCSHINSSRDSIHSNRIKSTCPLSKK